jgi:acetoin utilization protein AcuC
MVNNQLKSGRGPVIFIGSEIYRLEVFKPPHPLAMPRAMLVKDVCEAAGWLTATHYYETGPATVSDLCAFHDSAYIAALARAEVEQDLPPDLRQKYRIGADANVIHPAVFRRPAISAGGALLAASLIGQGATVHAPGVGNHHGQPARAAGFCFVNDIALCILRLRTLGFRRIAYIDFDAHHGDGVEQAFAPDPDILTLSIHEAGRWPRTGLAHDPAHAIYNFPVPPGFCDAELSFLLDAAILPILTRFAPEVILVLPGADALADDPLAKLSLTNNGLWSAISAVLATAPRRAVFGGGGYNPFALARAWAGIWALLNNIDLPEMLTDEVQTILRKLAYHRNATVPESWITTLLDPASDAPVRDEVKRLGVA